MPAFIPPQLCKSQDRPPSVSSWLHEIKFDGYRFQMRIEARKVQLKTRKGLDWTKRFSAIAKDAQVLPDAIIDGEICALDDSGAPDFAALQAALSEGRTDDLVYFAFDLLFADSEDLRDMRLDERSPGWTLCWPMPSPVHVSALSSISGREETRCFVRPAGCHSKA